MTDPLIYAALEELRGKMLITRSEAGVTVVEKAIEEIERLDIDYAYAIEEINRLNKVVESQIKTIQDLTAELEDYRSIAEKAISDKDKFEKIIKEILYALPVGNINTHTPDTIPERVLYWVQEAADECRMREKWEELADSLIEYVYGEIALRTLHNKIFDSDTNQEQIKIAGKLIKQYEELKGDE